MLLKTSFEKWKWGLLVFLFCIKDSCADPCDDNLLSAMYQSGGTHAQIFQQTSTEQYKKQFGEALYGAGSDLIKSELSAYGDKLLGSGSAFVHI